MTTQVGLLMTRNEADVLPEALAAHCRYFDIIVALDGSTDGGRAMIESCPAVVKCFHDEDILKPGERWNDSCRNPALEWIRDHFGVENVWVTLLHADEFFFDSPIEYAERASVTASTFVMWGEYRFFLHTSDRARFSSALCPLPSALPLYYVGPFFENRQFLLSAHQLYRPGEDHCTLPRGPVAPVRARHIPRYQHYPWRSPEQCARAYREKVVERYWQPDHAWLKDGHVFVDCPPKPANSPLAKWDRVAVFDGTLPDPAQFLPEWWKG